MPVMTRAHTGPSILANSFSWRGRQRIDSPDPDPPGCAWGAIRALIPQPPGAGNPVRPAPPCPRPRAAAGSFWIPTADAESCPTAHRMPLARRLPAVPPLRSPPVALRVPSRYTHVERGSGDSARTGCAVQHPLGRGAEDERMHTSSSEIVVTGMSSYRHGRPVSRGETMVRYDPASAPTVRCTRGRAHATEVTSHLPASAADARQPVRNLVRIRGAVPLAVALMIITGRYVAAPAARATMPAFAAALPGHRRARPEPDRATGVPCAPGR